ncbi:MAG: DUF4252 domain-containing protein [Bacteroidetes bacterium]|nr:DUF4252 domain-containing protein [Bacteroidota bacterium]
MRNLLILLFLGTSVSGCASYELMRVRNDLARQAPEARIGDGYAMSFGRISLGLASWLAGLGGDEDAEMARAVLSEVRRVQFARYDVNGAFDAASLRMPGRLRSYLEQDDWYLLASIREESEAVWVVYKEKDDIVVDLLAVVMGQEELVLAKISGDLNAVVAAALMQQDINIPFFGEEEPAAEHPSETEVMEAAMELIP